MKRFATDHIRPLVILGVIALAIAAAFVYHGRVPNTPEDVTTAFFSEWIEHAADPDGDPIEDRLYAEKENLVTEDFIRSADAAIEAASAEGRFADPVLCAEELPQSFSVEPAYTRTDLARMGVFASYGMSERIISVFLKPVDGRWKIDIISCGS